MSDDAISSENISELIEHLMKSKDPATVGLRRILKKKSEQGQDFPLQDHALEEFAAKGSHSNVFSDNEKRLLELEKETLELKKELTSQKKNAEQAIQTAYKKGLEEGIKQGEEAGKALSQDAYNQQLKIIEERLVTLFNSITESRKSLYLEAHRNVLDLCVLMVRRIINTELSVNPDIVLSVIKKALTFIADRQEFVLRVSPDDLETVTKKQDLWTSISDRLNAITVEQDERIEKGGCIIESNTGITDARIPVQIGELIEVIDETWDDLVTSGGIQADEETGDVVPHSEPEELTVEEEPQVIPEEVIDEGETGESIIPDTVDTDMQPEQDDNSDPPDIPQEPADEEPQPLT